MARASALKRVGGKSASAKSKTGDPKCSAAMSVFASKGWTASDNGMSLAEAHAMLGKCRSKSARLKSADRRESAGDRAGAAKQRSYANRGITTKQEADRAKRAKELVAQRAAKQAELKAKVAASPAAVTAAPKGRPMTAEEIAARRAKQGLRDAERGALARRAKTVLGGASGNASSAPHAKAYMTKRLGPEGVWAVEGTPKYRLEARKALKADIAAASVRAARERGYERRGLQAYRAEIDRRAFIPAKKAELQAKREARRRETISGLKGEESIAARRQRQGVSNPADRSRLAEQIMVARSAMKPRISEKFIEQGKSRLASIKATTPEAIAGKQSFAREIGAAERTLARQKQAESLYKGSGFRENMYRSTDRSGKPLGEGMGYVRQEDGRYVGYSRREAARETVAKLRNQAKLDSASRPAVNPAVAASIAARRARQAAPDRAAKINELRTERAARTIDREFAKAPGGNRNFVTLESLRARMPHIKHEEFNAGMHKLRMDRTMSLAPHEGMAGPATPGMRAAAIAQKGGRADGLDDIYMYALRREGVPRRKVSRVAKGGILKGS